MCIGTLYCYCYCHVFDIIFFTLLYYISFYPYLYTHWEDVHIPIHASRYIHTIWYEERFNVWHYKFIYIYFRDTLKTYICMIIHHPCSCDITHSAWRNTCIYHMYTSIHIYHMMIYVCDVMIRGLSRTFPTGSKVLCIHTHEIVKHIRIFRERWNLLHDTFMHMYFRDAFIHVLDTVVHLWTHFQDETHSLTHSCVW